MITGYSPGSEPTLELHSRAATSVGGTSPLRLSQHMKKFQMKADDKKTENSKLKCPVFRSWP